MVAAADNFFAQCDAEPYARHGRSVLNIARKAGIVEGPRITDKTQPLMRREANAVLAALCLYHTLDPDAFAATPLSLPLDVQNAPFMRELYKFRQMTEVVRSGGAPRDLIPILNSGSHAPLALLVILADYAATHDYHARVESFSGRQREILRTYPDINSAHSAMLADALFGETLWAPIAELFGYAGLAGDIMQHAYRVNHPELHDHIVNVLKRQSFKRLSYRSRYLLDEIGSEIEVALKSAGFEFRIESRPMKSQGKLMRKICLKIHASNHPGVPFNPLGIKDEIRSSFSSFDLYQVHDWSAKRVTITGYHGSDPKLQAAFAASDGTRIYAAVRRLITRSVDRQCKRFKIPFEDVVYTFIQKPNGYTAGHWDVRGRRREFLPFEIQVNLDSWDKISRYGGAAHYYYLGGNPSLIDGIGAAYHDILYGLLGKSLSPGQEAALNKPNSAFTKSDQY